MNLSTKNIAQTFLLSILFLISCKDSDPTVGPILPEGPIQGKTASFSALSPSSAKSGQTLTLTGENFSTTLSENLVIFTTQNAAVNVPVKTATTTTITVEVPPTAVTGMIAVKVKGVTAQMTSGFTAALTILP